MKPAVIAALVAALLASGLWYRHHVYESGYTAGVASQKAIGDAALAKANADARIKQDQLQAEADESEMKRAMGNEKYAKDLEVARADVRAGRERLSIAGACSSRPANSAQAGAATGPGSETRTDLLPGTADALIRIAGASAEDVRSYNALLDRYNAVCQ